MSANGFTILKHKFRLNFTPVVFNLQNFETALNTTKNDEFFIKTDNYLHDISVQMGNEITILDISPDTLFFQFDNLIEKEITIKHNFDLEFENQFYLNDSVSFSPSMVTVKGPHSILDTLKYVTTIPGKFKKLKENITQNTEIQKIEGLTIKPERISFTIPISQFTEYSVEVPITKYNVPEGINFITFPGKATVKCLISISDYKAINASNFIIGIDYSKINAEKNIMPIQVFKAPEHIKKLNFQPLEVEYIIEKK